MVVTAPAELSLFVTLPRHSYNSKDASGEGKVSGAKIIPGDPTSQLRLQLSQGKGKAP